MNKELAGFVPTPGPYEGTGSKGNAAGAGNEKRPAGQAASVERGGELANVCLPQKPFTLLGGGLADLFGPSVRQKCQFRPSRSIGSGSLGVGKVLAP
ncbi:hypothetical protein chiPu_0021504 [Chiloscyllium punctatum]|uniref:Uncharacterized protein n=1 Tax=Chiloscyllium punctatum TaxID=137246 RepID=A0A401RGE4_CHIPU|nr:hypothetical protein [Chiloscyllium punctatum]